MTPIKLFKSAEERETERRIQVRTGRRKAERHIVNQKKSLRKYWEMATKAYRLSDRELVAKLAALISTTRADINRWERRMLYFDMIEAQRDQVQAGAEFAAAFDAMAKSVMVNARPEDLSRIETNLERSTMLAEELEDRLTDFQGTMDEMLSGAEDERPQEIKEIMASIEKEAEASGEPGLDAGIETSLKQIDALLKREGY
jgi:hypothetical protein